MRKRIQTTGKQTLSAQGQPLQRRRGNGGQLFKAIAAGAVLLLLVLNLLSQFVSVVRYYGNGMEPTLSDREILLVVKTDQVEAGDVIAFYYNNKVLVRRVVCTGGAELDMDDAGNVFIDGEALAEPYVAARSLGQCNLTFPIHVPAGQLFVMGDNRPVAMDSRLREIGTISPDRVIGKVIL